jgi:hypothetical protein
MYQHAMTARIRIVIEAEIKAPRLLDAGDVMAPDSA